LRDGSGSVPLRDAALNGNRAVGELLLAQGAEVDAKDPETGATPLYEAVSFKRSDFAKLLIEKGASTSVKTKSGKTIAETAAANDLTEVVALIRKTGPHDQPERR
jgi:ankyrin repeat protein